MVIFDASGDLTRRKLIPAIFDLARQGRLPAPFSIVGVARTPMDHNGFRARLDAVASTAAENVLMICWLSSR